MKATIRNLGFSFFLGALAFLFCAPSQAPAQDLRAAISGTVTDPSGAPVPGAKVQITDTQRNMTFNVTTNAEGRYSSGPLLPSQYSIAVEAKGFKRYVRTNILLHLTQKAGVNVTLELGAVSQTVNVSSRAPLLNTETADRGAVIPPEFVQDLPNNGRDVFNLVFSMVGAYQPCTCGGQGASITGSGHATFGINGNAGGASGRTTNNGILLNGASDTNGGNTVGFQPALYSVDEIQVKTNTYDAQYGRTAGGFVAITTKAGTNQLHGIVFDSVSNSALAANTWDNNLHGEPKSSYITNNYGFEVGGPVYIPKVFNGRDKLFFMLSLDRTPSTSPSHQTATVPTAAERTGDFSGLFNGQGKPVTIYDPQGPLVTTGGGYIRGTAFSGNVIPANRINSVGQKILDYYPLPTGPGIGPAHTDNHFSNGINTDNVNQWTERMDYRLTDRNRFYAQYGKTTETILNYGYFPEVPLITNGSSAPGNNNTMQGVIDWTATLSPTTTFDLRGGIARTESVRTNTVSAAFDPTTLGFPASLVSQFYQKKYPNVNMGKYSNQGGGKVSSFDDTLDIHADVGKVVAKHLMKMGAEFINYGMGTNNPGDASGSYTFDSQWTQLNPLVANSTSGDAAADLLLGLPSSGDVDRNANPYFTSRYWALYFQDDWKVTPRLSLTLGLRWDYDTPMEERHNRISRGFAFNQASPLAAAVAAAPGAQNCPACASLKGGLLFASSSGSSRYAWNPDYSGFQPRLGAAFEINPRTVLRGGFGMYRLLTAENEEPGLPGFSAQTPVIPSLDGGLTPSISLSNPFPGGLITPFGSSLGLASFLGNGFPFTSLNFPSPKNYQWSFGIQRELPANIVVEAAYVGNETTGYPVGSGINAIPAALLGQPASYYKQLVTNPFAGLLPANPSLNGATIPLQDLLVPYPQFNSSLQETNAPIGWTRYDALQVHGTRRFANGTSLMVNYTLSKNLMRVSPLNAQDFVPQNPSQSRLEERLATFDVPQKLDILGTYNLPFGRGRQFASNVPSVVNYAIGGWRLGWNITYQSGFPVPYPNAAAIKPGSAALTGSQQSLYHWFNTSLFPNVAGPAPFTLRTFPSFFPDVRYMGLHDWDLSLIKEFPIYERLRLRVRGDFINAFNTPYFTQMQSLDVTNPQFGQIKLSPNNNPRTIVMEADIIF